MSYPAAVAALLALVAACLATPLRLQSTAPSKPQTVAANQSATANLQSDAPRLESLIRDAMKKRDIPAVCFGIVDGDKLRPI